MHPSHLYDLCKKVWFYLLLSQVDQCTMGCMVRHRTPSFTVNRCRDECVRNFPAVHCVVHNYQLVLVVLVVLVVRRKIDCVHSSSNGFLQVTECEAIRESVQSDCGNTCVSDTRPDTKLSTTMLHFRRKLDLIQQLSSVFETHFILCYYEPYVREVV